MTRRGWVLFALMSVIWGIPYLMIKVAVEEVSVPVLVFARTVLGAVVLLPLAVRAGGLGAARRHWPAIVAFAAFEIAIPWWLLSDAERTLSSSMSGLLIAAVPIMAALLARMTRDTDRLGARRWIGLAVGFGGVAVLAAPHLDGGGDALSVFEVLGTALCYAIGPLIAARKLKDVSTLAVTGAALALTTIVYLPPAVVTWPTQVPSPQVLAALAGLGLVCTALAFVVFLELIGEVGTSRAMVFTYINPAVAVGAGVLILGEDLTVTIVAAFVLIIVGSVLATASGKGRRVAPEPEADATALSRQA
jgi:drug/metabolite transporter (DMT)-like permease